MNDSVNNSKDAIDENLQDDELISEIDIINESIEEQEQSLPEVDQQILAEIEEIQDAIEDGDELIDDVETVAGETGDGGRSSAVNFDRVGLEVIASSNYQTSGFDFAQQDVTISTTENVITTVTVSITGPGAVVEGEVTENYTVSITEALTTDLTVTFNYTTNDADGNDYTAVDSVVILAGETTANFNITTNDDNIVEAGENFTLTIENVTPGGLEDVRISDANSSVTTTITDEPVPTDPDTDTALVSISGPSNVVEGELTTDYTVSITEAPTSDLTVIFNYTTTDADGNDYTAVNSVVILAGETSATFNITTIDDNFAEGSEDFTLSIDSVTTGGLEDVRVSSTNGSITTTITDEPAPSTPDSDTAIVSITGPSNVVEGELTTDYTVSITETPTSDLTVSFNYTTTDADGNDYTTVNSVVILAGETSATFNITTIDDNFAEGSEDFTISIDSVTSGGLEDVQVSTTNSAITTTITDEPVPSTPDSDTAIVSIIGPSNVVEGELTTDYTVSITEAPTSDLTVTFNYTTTDADGNDYTAVNSVVILAGETSATFNITTIDDNFAEGSEDFTISIDSVTSGGLEDVQVSTTNSAITTTITDEPVPSTPDSDTAIVSIAGPSNVVEGDVTTDYTVSITEAPTSDLTVTFNYTTTDADGNDYTAVNSVVILAGETSATFNITTIDDNFAEGSENFTISIDSVTSGGLEDVQVSTTNSAITTTITDEPVPSTPDSDTAIVSIAGPSNVVEGDVTTDYTVSITEAPTSDLTVSFNYTTTDADGNDYTAVNSVVILAGETSATFNITTIDDNFAEGSEDFTISIDSVTSGGLEDVQVSTTNSAITTTITDEPVPSTPDSDTAIVSIAGPSNVVEGDVTTDYTVSITEAPTSDLTVTFNYTTTDADGNDYTAVNSVVILAGETSATFNITTIDDNFAEVSEDFTISIDSVTSGGLEDLQVSTTNSAITTTISDEPVPSTPDSDTAIVSIAGPSNVVEGDVTTDYTVSITEAPTSDLTVSFNYTTTDADGNDYTAVNSVVILAGETSATFNITTIDDSFAEGSEDFTISIDSVTSGGLEDVQVSTSDNAITTTIIDSDAVPSILIDDQTVNEDAGTITFTVSLSNPSTSIVSVDYVTNDGTATVGTDVQNDSGTLTFAVGETSKTITLSVNDDDIYEISENFTIDLSAPVNATIADNQGTGTINDEDGTTPGDKEGDQPSLSVSTASAVEGDVEIFTVSLSNPSTQDVSVDLTSVTGTAIASDFDATNMQVSTDAGVTWTNATSATIVAGETSVLVRIPTVDDSRR
ncbi:beta strand repeat-containing protein [Psychromonas sp. KJ10-10]|uniref:beta strand repeat-containing protein n=1 Tax=Psychromonas sp. KJ10-10 TaxID=3391823 RepID=UPI0039B43FC9